MDQDKQEAKEEAAQEEELDRGRVPGPAESGGHSLGQGAGQGGPRRTTPMNSLAIFPGECRSLKAKTAINVKLTS